MSSRNRQALRYHLECDAVGRFPDDPIVRRNARLIKGVLDAHKEAKLDLIAALLGAKSDGG
jgi:hypothetical protein